MPFMQLWFRKSMDSETLTMKISGNSSGKGKWYCRDRFLHADVVPAGNGAGTCRAKPFKPGCKDGLWRWGVKLIICSFMTVLMRFVKYHERIEICFKHSLSSLMTEKRNGHWCIMKNWNIGIFCCSGRYVSACNSAESDPNLMLPVR